ncbi:hypothetical protein ACSQ67_008190 [Phaseolus vulgaris]
MVSRFGSSQHNRHHSLFCLCSNPSLLFLCRKCHLFWLVLLTGRKVSLLLFIEAIFFAAIILVTMLVLHGTTRRSLVVGIICDVFNVMINDIGAIYGLVRLLLYGFYYCKGENNDDGVKLQSTTQVPISECPRDLEA